MKQLIIILFLGAVVWVGYHYLQLHSTTTLSESTASLKTTKIGGEIDSVTNVLGASTTNAVAIGESVLNTLTAGKSGPIINRMVGNIQSQAQQLPAQVISTAQYQYCKNVVTQYESKNSQ